MGAPIRLRELVLVTRENSPETRLQAYVDLPRLATAGDRVQAPSGRTERDQRDQQEIRDKFEPEAHYLQFRFRS